MKTMGLALLVLAAGAGAAVAGSPFAGTWKLDVARSRFTGDSFTYTKTASGYRYSNGGPMAYDFAVDGKDHKTVADRTVAWTSAGKESWDLVYKAHGAVMSKTHRTLSADGKTMTSTYTEFRADGTTAHESDVYTRVSGGPGLAGVWKNTKVQAANDVMIIATPTPGSFAVSFPGDKESTAGATDGRPVAIKGPNVPPGAMASYRAGGRGRWSTEVSLKGRVFRRGVMAVSADGKTLTNTTWVPGKESEKTVEVWVRS